MNHHQRGGFARAAVLSPQERQRIARKAAHARWHKDTPMTVEAAPRAPKVRQCMILLLPTNDPKKDACVCVREQKETVRLTIYEADSTIGKKVNLTISEAHKLADFLATTCHRVETRPSTSP